MIARVFVCESAARSSPEPAYRRVVPDRESHRRNSATVLHHESDSAAMRAATKAVEELLRWTYGERWRLSAWERAQPQIPCPPFIKHMADHVDDVDAREQAPSACGIMLALPKSTQRSSIHTAAPVGPPVPFEAEPGARPSATQASRYWRTTSEPFAGIRNGSFRYSPNGTEDPSSRTRPMRREVLKQKEFPTNTTAAFMAKACDGRSIAARLVPARTHRDADA